MNKLEIRNITLSVGQTNDCFFIDGIPLHDHLTKPFSKHGLRRADDLAIAWKAAYDNDGDARFMRFLMEKDKLNLPILLCPEDLDFTCTVIVADTEKSGSSVMWKRIGMFDHSCESRTEEKLHGIAYVEAYSDEDWDKYNDPELYDVDSSKWRSWISANWSEELFRRRVNYTYPLYQDEKNINWLYECDLCFDRAEYDMLIASCRPVFAGTL